MRFLVDAFGANNACINSLPLFGVGYAKDFSLLVIVANSLFRMRGQR